MSKKRITDSQNVKTYQVSLTNGDVVIFKSPYQLTIDTIDFLTDEKVVSVWTVNNEWEYIFRKQIVKVKKVEK